MIARLLAAAGVWMIAESVSRAILGRLAMVIDDMTLAVSRTARLLPTRDSLSFYSSSRLLFVIAIVVVFVVVVANRQCFFQLATSELPYR